MFSRLRCVVQRDRDTSHVVVRGHLDGRTLPRLTDTIWRRAMSGDRAVSVDLSRVSHFDSNALLSLLGVERLAERQLDCEIDLRGIEDATYRIVGI